MNGIGQNGPLTDPKPLDRSKPNSTQVITFDGTPQRPKLIISQSKELRPQRVNTYALC
jgi:hypothetical protein